MSVIPLLKKPPIAVPIAPPASETVRAAVCSAKYVARKAFKATSASVFIRGSDSP